MNFEYLCKSYELGSFLSVEPLNPGTEAQVWRLETDQGAFLVRTLKGKEQGEREWSIHQHLRSGGFAAMAAIVVPHFEEDDQWYQVQECLTGSMPNPTHPGMAVTMANLAKRLADGLADYPGGAMIHGDLGPWNLLVQESGQLMVIDFGEARPGDAYFDYATLFAGVLNHSPAEQRAAVCGEFLLALNCDRKHLLEQLYVWAEQQIARWNGKNETMVARFTHAANWAKEHIYDI